jgi:hypothetical protein
LYRLYRSSPVPLVAVKGSFACTRRVTVLLE